MSDLKKKYAEQLGMDVGTAQNRLVKDVLFKLASDAGLNICHQCGGSITQPEFSIEHKEPWRNSENAYDLFFDLENIGFSHRACNYSAARKIAPKCNSDEERKQRKNELGRTRYKKYMANRSEEQKVQDKLKRRERYLRTGN